MLTPAHISASYLLAQGAKYTGTTISRKDVAFIILTGNIVDLDVWVPMLFGYPGLAHHYFPIHTPIVVFSFYFVIYLVFRKRLEKRVWLLGVIAILLHFIMDDLPYLLSLLGFGTARPEIFWLYPFDARLASEFAYAKDLFLSINYGLKDFFHDYINAITFPIDVGITLLGGVVFLFQNQRKLRLYRRNKA